MKVGSLSLQKYLSSKEIEVIPYEQMQVTNERGNTFIFHAKRTYNDSTSNFNAEKLFQRQTKIHETKEAKDY